MHFGFITAKGWIALADALPTAAEAVMRVEGREYPPAGAYILSRVPASRCSARDCKFVAPAGELRVQLITREERILAKFPPVARFPEDFPA